MAKKKYCTQHASEYFQKCIEDFTTELNAEGQKKIYDKMVEKGLITNSLYPLKTYYSDIRNARKNCTGVFRKPEILASIIQVMEFPPSTLFQAKAAQTTSVQIDPKSIDTLVTRINSSRRKRKTARQSGNRILSQGKMIQQLTLNIILYNQYLLAVNILFLNYSMQYPDEYPHGKKNRELQHIDLALERLFQTIPQRYNHTNINNISINEFISFNGNNPAYITASYLLIFTYQYYALSKIIRELNKYPRTNSTKQNAVKIENKTSLVYEKDIKKSFNEEMGRIRVVLTKILKKLDKFDLSKQTNSLSQIIKNFNLDLSVILNYTNYTDTINIEFFALRNFLQKTQVIQTKNTIRITQQVYSDIRNIRISLDKILSIGNINCLVSNLVVLLTSPGYIYLRDTLDRDNPAMYIEAIKRNILFDFYGKHLHFECSINTEQIQFSIFDNLGHKVVFTQLYAKEWEIKKLTPPNTMQHCGKHFEADWNPYRSDIQQRQNTYIF